MSKMRSDTPAIEIREKDLQKNSSALERLLELIPVGNVLNAIDLRYGLGGWAEKVTKRFPDVTYKGYEKDRQTFRRALLSKPNQVRLFRRDSQLVSGQTDLLLIDFNNLTVLKREPLDDILSKIKTQYLVFTDVASSKIHLNFRSYGLNPDFSMVDYWEQFKISGFGLIGFVRDHHHASSALYKKTLQI